MRACKAKCKNGNEMENVQKSLQVMVYKVSLKAGRVLFLLKSLSPRRQAMARLGVSVSTTGYHPAPPASIPGKIRQIRDRESLNGPSRLTGGKGFKVSAACTEEMPSSRESRKCKWLGKRETYMHTGRTAK